MSTSTPRPDLTVTVCRDCCCGSATKHPGTDHDAQVAVVEELRAAHVRVRVAECLDECDRSNVVQVRDHRLPRRRRDTWLGGVLTEADTAALVAWVRGGAGPVPADLRRLVFTHQPPR